MQCGCYVLTEHTHGGKRVKRTVVPLWWTDRGPFPVKPEHKVEKLLADGYQICTGTIRASIAAEDEAYYGGTSATLEVGYQCSECGNAYYPHLPDKYGIEEFVTARIAEMDGEAMIEAKIAEQIEQEKTRARMLRQYKKEEAERARVKAEKTAARIAAREAKAKAAKG